MKKFLLPLAFLCVAVAGTPLLAVEPLPTDVASKLQFMREEEKLARDVYLFYADLYPDQRPGANIFARIAESEQRHTDAIKRLLVKYGVPDLAVVNDGELVPGEFSEESGLQEVYDVMVSLGDDPDEGYAGALLAGVLIEKKDMTDIAEAILIEGTPAPIVKVYSNLLAGSGKHLAAFERVLEKVDPDTDADAAELVQGGTAGAGPQAGRAR